MRIKDDGVFHVSCCYTKRAVCYCAEGTPQALRDPDAAKTYARQAAALWDYWRHPADALFPEVTAKAPPLAAPAVEAPPRAASPPAPPLSEEHRAMLERVEAVRKKATYSAMTAASLAARGGLVYAPPTGVDIAKFMEHVETQSHAELEASAAEVLRARAMRSVAASAPPALPLADASGTPRASGEGVPVMSGQLMRYASADLAQLRGPVVAPPVGAAASPFVPQPLPAAAPPQPPPVGRAPQPRNASFVYFPVEHRRGPRKRAPPKAWRLLPEHITATLRGELLQVLWPEDRQWWPALVVGVTPAAGTASFVYETGEREDGVRLAYLVSNAHVAWLNAATAERHGAAPAPAMGGRKRGASAAPPSRQASAAAPVGAPYADADGSELDAEEAVLNKLKGVTKRQRAAAAKQAAKSAAQQAAAATTSAASPSMFAPAFSAGGPAMSGPTMSEPAMSDPLAPSLGGFSMPSFMPDPSLELGMGSMLGGDSSLLPSGPPSFGAPPQPSRIVHHLLQMGNGVLGLGVMLHINGITLPATISGTRPAQEALILEVRGRTVVVRSHDEGVRFGLSLVRQQPQTGGPPLP